MATAAEQLHALLSNQHNVLAQLEPTQIQLFGLVAKLKGISLEESHAESKASFESGMAEYHQAFIRFQEVSRALTFGHAPLLTILTKAQAQLKALNLKFLRPGTNDGGQVEIEQGVLSLIEEDIFGFGFVAQLGAVSDAKFLEICNEQRDVVDDILVRTSPFSRC